MKKNIILGVVALAVIAILVTTYVVLSGTSDKELTNNNSVNENGDVVASVNGEDISRAEFEAFLVNFSAEQGFDIAMLDEEQKKQVQSQVINILVSQTLLQQAVDNAAVTVPVERINEEMEVVKNNFADDEAFQAALSAEGINEEKLKEQISTGLATETYLDQEIDILSIEVTEEEIVSAYEQAGIGEDGPALEDVRDQIEKSVIQQKQQALIATLLESLRAEAEVEIFI